MISNATGILTVSSVGKKKTPTAANKNQALDLEVCYEDIMLGEVDAMDQFDEHMCAYLSLIIEEKFYQNVKNHKYKCINCVEVLKTDKNRIKDDLLQMKAECIQPTVGTFKIVIFANAITRMLSADSRQGNCFDAVQKVIEKNMDINDLYLKFHDVHEGEADGHKAEFVSEIVKTYLAMKSTKIAAKITEKEQGELIRRKRKRAVILAGQ